ncbi:MAG TPA: WD40 repeat domain-containing protein, partial [Gemmataceae bacterium]|nr:WD40 repeat domain-containing protein [Gemmataceae bacterium]
LPTALPLVGASQLKQPPATTPANRPAQAQEQPRLDRHGDPLPPGAVARLGTLRFRTAGEVEALAFAPDGKTIAVSSGAGLSFFDTASGKRLSSIPPPASLWARDDRLVFSPDGKRLATRKQVLVDKRFKGVMRIWELTGDRKSRDYDAENALWVGWSAGGEPLAVCLEAGGLRLHELAAGRSRRFDCPNLPQPQVPDDTVFAAAPGGRALAVADEARQAVHLWDTTVDQPRRTLRPKGENVSALAFSPDGSKLVSVTRQAVQFWDVASGKMLYAIDSRDNYRSALFSPDGKLLAVMDGGRAICFWDAATGKERGRTQGNSNFAANFTFSPDGKTLATLTRLGCAVRLWEVPTGQPKAEPVGHTHRPQGISFSPDGRRVATSGSFDGTIHVWDLATGEALWHISRPQGVRNGLFSTDGHHLFSAWIDDNVWVSDARTGKRQHVLILEDPDRPDTRQSAISMRLSADGKTLIAFSYYYAKKQGAGPRCQETLITGWDTSTHKQLFRYRHPGMDFWGTVSPDARLLAVPHPSTEGRGLAVGMGPMRLEGLATGEPLLRFPALEGQIQTWPLAFSPDGRLLAAYNSRSKGVAKDGSRTFERTVRLWEVATASEVLSLPAAGQNRVAFSADGRLLALPAPGPAVLVWDLARGRELRRFNGFDAEVTDLAFSPDGRRLLSGLADSTLLVWDVGPRDAAAVKLGPEGVAQAWADLASPDARRAFRARGALARSPAEAVALLKDRLRRAQPADAQHLHQLLADLGSERFTVRDKAQAALEKLGELAEGALRQALTTNPTLEVRRRLEGLLARLRRPVTQPEAMRSVRAVAVLEDIATPATRELLAELAAGATDARLTREALAALRRLGR